MMSRVHSFVLQGIDAVPCAVEADISDGGLPRTTVVGLPDTAVRESGERVRTALLNSGFRYPLTRVTVNLAPAHIPKEGPVYDLPIALAILIADGTIKPAVDLRRHLIAGELALDGQVRPVRGVISMGLLARAKRGCGVLVPQLNAGEAAAVDQVQVRGVSDLGQAVAFLNGTCELKVHPPVDFDAAVSAAAPEIDFADVRGQETAKRTLTIAAAGSHNVVMIGPPGTGKSMLAKALSGIMPPLTRDEALEVTRIYSSVGQLPAGKPIVLHRPIRTPHHTASAAAIIGGGSIPRPGDVSLAHRGVLFLDEMPEFSRQVLETLRQPMEDGHVTIARSRGSSRFPARFMLIGALNPTADGNAAASNTIDRYLARLSRPLVDRIDMHVEVPTLPYHRLATGARGADSATVRAEVLSARQQQLDRQGPPTNAELAPRQLDRHAPLSAEARGLLGQAMTELGLSARAYDKIRRVARTIADLEERPDIETHHVSEAIQYRLLDRT